MRPSHCRLCSNPPDCFATLAGRLSLKPDARIAMMAHATALTRREAGGHVRQSQWRGHVQQPPPPWDKAVALERWWLAPERAPRVTAVCGYVAGSSAVVKVREWDGCGPPCAACRGVRETVREVVRETSHTA